MFSKAMTNRMKAAAVAALMCLSVAAATLPAMTDPMMVDAVSVGTTIAVDEKYIGYTADVASSGIKTLTFTLVADYTGGFTYGFGIGTATAPEYWAEVAEEELSVTSGEEFTVTVDVSSLELSYTPSTEQYPGKYEFRNYYSPDGSGVKIVSVVANSTATTNPTNPSSPSNPGNDDNGANTDGSTSQNPTASNKSWTFVDNGDGTGTMTATQARKLDNLNYLLTKGFDEDYYAELGETPGEDDPINSHKFAYSDFGLGAVGSIKTVSGITIESIEATITSDAPFKRFMYGGGLNVGNGTPADTESAKVAAGVKEEGGYWYNDMGKEVYEECIEAGAEFGVDITMGYDVTSETMQLGEYFNVIWDVPEQVKPYEDSGSISFQFWYGEEDTEEYTELETCTLAGAVLTYTEEKTFDYTDTVSATVGEDIAIEEMCTGIKYADMGLDENASVKAIVFHLDVPSDLDTLVYGIGTSVGEEWMMFADAEGGDAWNYVLTDVTAGAADICWIVPEGVDINELYGNVQLGYWYGGKEGTTVDSVTLESVDVYYYEEEIPTTEPTPEPTPEPLTPKYGDANCDGDVDVLDIIVLNKNLLGGGSLTEQGKVNADVDLDGDATANDSLNIMKYIVKLITELPV